MKKKAPAATGAGHDRTTDASSTVAQRVLALVARLDRARLDEDHEAVAAIETDLRPALRALFEDEEE